MVNSLPKHGFPATTSGIGTQLLRGGERRGKGRNQKNVCESGVQLFRRRLQSMAEWESDGYFLGFSECTSAVSPSVTVVPVVPVSPSIVTVGISSLTLTVSLLIRRHFLSQKASRAFC